MDKMGKKVKMRYFRKSVILNTLFFLLLLEAIHYSYAYFTFSKERSEALKIIVTDLAYTLTGDNVSNQSVQVGANQALFLNLTLTTKSEKESEYQLYYKNELPQGVQIVYQKDNKTKGSINPSSPIVIPLVIENTTSTTVSIEFGVKRGFQETNLILEETEKAITEPYVIKYPTITVTPPTVTINAGTTYNLKTGVTAKDPYGKDLTSRITMTQGNGTTAVTWNNHTIGTTKIYYHVTDDYGTSNSSMSALREITVNKVYVYNRGNYQNSFTGGWQQLFYTANNPSYYGTYNMHTIYTSNMGLNAAVLNTASSTSRVVTSSVTKNKIDITNYNKLCIYYNAEGVADNVNWFGCMNNQATNIDQRSWSMGSDVTENGKEITKCITVNHAASSCYPALMSWSREEGTGVWSSFTTMEMWFE